MKKSKHFSAKVSLLLAAMLLVSLAATPVFAAEYKLRIAVSHKPVSPWVQAAQYFEKELEALSGGRIDVSVHHSATLAIRAKFVKCQKQHAGSCDSWICPVVDLYA